MDIIIMRQTIDIILERIQTTSFRIGLSKTNIDLLQSYLKTIKHVVYNPLQGDDAVVQDWLRKLKDATNDLIDLIEDLSSDNDVPQQSRFFFLKSKPQICLKAVTKNVKKVLEEVAGELPDMTTTDEPLDITFEETWEKKINNEIKKLVDPAGIGRKKEKKEIIDQLMSLHTKPKESNFDDVPNSDHPDDSNVPVITIVGYDGMGKTKLASLICKDEQVEVHFGLPIYANVVVSIEKKITEKPLTNEKGYLVVIENLKTEIADEDLKKLNEILTRCGGKSAILITTTSKLVANNITAGIRSKKIDANFVTFKPHVLQGLNEEESWSLFLSIRGGDHINEEMERKFVMDCGGVPSLIIFTTIFLKEHVGDGVVVEDHLHVLFLKMLKLRYYDKLPYLWKMCFSFCSLFPRDHLIDVDRLIHLWTAEGFLMELEKLHRPHFNDFFIEMAHILKDMEEDEFGVVKRCRILPLMHDLARFVTDEKENVTIDPEGERVHEGVLRASFDFSLDISREIPPSFFKKINKLRAILLWKTTQTLIPNEHKTTCDQIFKTFKTTLRMLDLHDLGIKTLPRSIGDMKNLRYLDLSLNTIEKLPSSITKLTNLQTLKLSQCYFLKELPKNIDKLINLNHLVIEGCLVLTHMPRKINKLHNSLQTLTLFVVSEENDLEILANLNNLRGQLEISHLENSNLKNSNYLDRKEHLQHLTLRWNHDDDYDQEEMDEEKNEGDSSIVDKETLDCLVPHSKMRSIFLAGYKGKTFSTWFSYIKCLVKLSLYDCSSCIYLPQLDQLLNLRVLELRRLDNLQYIVEDEVATTLHCPFLEELTISDCPNLKGWWKVNINGKYLPFFTCLSKLQLHYCPQLTCMPLFPNIDEELVIVGSNMKPLRATVYYGKKRCTSFSKLKSLKIASIEERRPVLDEWINYLTSLEKLDLKEWKNLKSLPKGFNQLISLQSLNIENCQELNFNELSTSNNEWEGLKNLCSLTIRENPLLKSLPMGVDKVTSLQDLQLHNCPQLTSLPESIDNLKSLDRLIISECDKLASLPKALKNLKSLQTLIVLDCTLLLPRCQPNTGDDWPQIANIRNKQVAGTNR